jgi:hypothetical protein
MNIKKIEELKNKETFWTICPECYGFGKKYTKLRYKARLRYEMALSEFEKNLNEGKACLQSMS